ncbi:hypothetical protein C5C31_14745 [Rathayibacter rathayi]|uniref:hypothetical protein n=1 Tax=Rathayibacter rathayi TaxID=33887 RepID=UPI000CE8299E|nr:hypothetical protein [Rathayibacter rathayi]PPG65129.1 hypothetical protein C5C02_14085 [Rathayibacter rathayi]PPH17096.1 hypothetical protein C5C31_14745 [Rathayibacter rathayi]
MRTWDFYLSGQEVVSNAWGSEVTQQAAIDVDLLGGLLRCPNPEHGDVEIAVPLARVVHEEYEAYGTHGSPLSNDDSRLLVRALKAVLARLGIDTFDPPFRDFETFRKYWQANDGHGSWQARRDMLNDQFGAFHEMLDARETDSLTGALADPISPRKATGWQRVDEELNEMRRHFQAARPEQDYSNVGNDAVAALEALSAASYEHAHHGEPGANEPPVPKTKARLDRVVEVELPGSENAELRKVVRAAIELAQATKHRRNGDRRSAGMAADAVLLVVNLVRRLR